MTTHPKEKLNISVIFPRQVLVLKQVPGGIKHLLTVLALASLQPVLVEAGTEQRLGQFPQITLDDGSEDVVVCGLQT